MKPTAAGGVSDGRAMLLPPPRGSAPTHLRRVAGPLELRETPLWLPWALYLEQPGLRRVVA